MRLIKLHYLLKLLALGFAILIFFGLCSCKPTSTNPPARAAQGTPVEFLLASEMIGKRWPDATSMRAYLERGKWIVAVLRRDCEHCNELLNKHFLVGKQFEDWNQFFFIAGASEWPGYIGQPRMNGRPDFELKWPNGREPFVAAPAIFIIEDGIISSASDGENADGFLDELWRRYHGK